MNELTLMFPERIVRYRVDHLQGEKSRKLRLEIEYVNRDELYVFSADELLNTIEIGNGSKSVAARAQEVLFELFEDIVSNTNVASLDFRVDEEQANLFLPGAHQDRSLFDLLVEALNRHASV